MATDGTPPPINAIRKKARAITDESWIKDFLHRAPAGMLATVADDQPFINSNLFVYDEAEHAIYLHTAYKGRARSNVEANAKVCYSVMQMGRLLPAETAANFSVEYASVVIFGRVTIVTDPTEGKQVLQKLMDKYAPHLKPGDDYQAPTDAELKVTAVYRIDIEQWSGKQNQKPDDFPGAYRFGEWDTD
jgi:uncharacterized protein